MYLPQKSKAPFLRHADVGEKNVNIPARKPAQGILAILSSCYRKALSGQRTGISRRKGGL
jgi:hypothetical protein